MDAATTLFLHDQTFHHIVLIQYQGLIFPIRIVLGDDDVE